MSGRRRAPNPAGTKTGVSVPKKHPPPAAFNSRLAIRRRLGVALLCASSAVLLLICFAPFDRWYVAYVALVPWGLAVAGGANVRWAMLWSYLAGVVFWAAGIYWMTWITMAGYVPSVLYLGLYWLVAGAVVRRAFLRGWPLWLALPIIWVALEYARAFALSGFPWFFLGHSQYARIPLIQITDITGQYGVSFFVAMVNGAIIDVLAQPLFSRTRRRRWPLTRRAVVAVGACAITAVTLLGYGTFRLNQNTTRPGPKVGVVQRAFPVSLSKAGASPQEMFDAHAESTAALKGAGCDLVVWPESMLGFAYMDPSFWFSFDAGSADPASPSLPLYSRAQQEQIRTYQRNLRRLERLIADLDCPLLAGGAMPASRAERLMYNSALLFDRDENGTLRIRRRYAKMHLVPFGEYVPFRESWPWLHKQLRRFVPPVMSQLEPGREVVRFEIAAKDAEDQTVRFATPICYEGSFARICRRMAMESGRKRIDMLVNISNDGWFVYTSSDRTHASTELAQHLTQYVFRAIENRVPVVRAANTGISAHVDSDGRIRAVVQRRGRRGMETGNLTAQILVDSRVSVYSLAGDIFAQAICLIAGVGILIMFWRKRDRKEQGL